MQSYFDLFFLEEKFDIDFPALETAYQKQIAEFHPDKFTNKSKKEQLFAVQNSSLINTAFETLKSPLKRATYLLSLSNIEAFDELDTRMDINFLTQQIELREHLESIRQSKEALLLEDFSQDIEKKMKINIASIQKAFLTQDLETVKNLVRQLKFYQQLFNQTSVELDALL